MPRGVVTSKSNQTNAYMHYQTPVNSQDRPAYKIHCALVLVYICILYIQRQLSIFSLLLFVLTPNPMLSMSHYAANIH